MADASKVALVTGASSGIGRATARAFLDHGYAVVLVDRDETAGLATEQAFRSAGECIFLPCDVSDEQAVETMMARAVSAYGRIDAAFNGAGIDGGFTPTADCTIETWDRIMSVNLRGLWLCLRLEIRQMLSQGGGAIVNCSSGAGLAGVPGLSAYSASKHGVIGLTRTAALDYARHNIRINAVCPGMIDTPMWQRSIPPEVTEQLLISDPIGRLGQASEIAAAVLWLCDPAASFVTGQALAVDGGKSAG